MALSPEVRAIAEEQAARDRDLLAALVKSGKVRRQGPATPFSRDIDRRVAALDGRGTINLAIRPKRRKKGKR